MDWNFVGDPAYVFKTKQMLLRMLRQRKVDKLAAELSGHVQLHNPLDNSLSITQGAITEVAQNALKGNPAEQIDFDAFLISVKERIDKKESESTKPLVKKELPQQFGPERQTGDFNRDKVKNDTHETKTIWDKKRPQKV